MIVISVNQFVYLMLRQGHWIKGVSLFHIAVHLTNKTLTHFLFSYYIEAINLRKKVSNVYFYGFLVLIAYICDIN